MTAVNTLIKRDSAHLITDAGAYDTDGRLVAALPKVALLPHINAAIACRGPSISVPLVANLLSAAASTYDGLKAKAPTFLHDVKPVLDASFAHCEFCGDFDVIVAGISETVGPDAWLVCNHERYGVEPWTAVQFAGLSMLPADAPMQERVFASIPDDVELVDPERDGRIILEAQRAFPMDHGGGRVFTGVGGFGQLVSIARDGTIISKVLCRWPDEIGQPLGAADVLAQFGRAAA